jgi:hypothetical protein
LTSEPNVALRPIPEDQQQKLKDDALLREVDDAYREEQVAEIARRYGVPVGIGLVLALLLFGGYLFWHSQREGDLGRQSEELVKSLDAIDAGNYDTAAPGLDKLVAEGGDGMRATARMLQAGVALRQGRSADAARLYGQVRADTDAPQPYRDLATIREVAVLFDGMDKAEVVKRLKPIAVPGNAWFGSAGELLAMAYLDQNRRDLAGPLFAQISKDKNAPQSVRSRARQLAGVLGVDAIEDVDRTLAEISEGGEAPAAPAQAPAAAQ